MKKQNFDNINDEVNKGWFLISFIPNVTEKFKNIINISLNKLSRMVRSQKDLY